MHEPLILAYSNWRICCERGQAELGKLEADNKKYTIKMLEDMVKNFTGLLNTFKEHPLFL